MHPRVLLRRLFQDRSARVGCGIVAGLLLFALLGPFLIGADPNISDFSAARSGWGGPPGPSATHPLGTDPLFRDILARLAHGARVSLGVAISATLLTLLIGTAVGVTAGYFDGSPIDRVLTGAVDVAMAFPFLLLITAIGVALEYTDAITVVLVLGLTAWTGVARLVRAKTIHTRRQLFVTAARALGLGHLRIIQRHILPSLLGTLLVLGSHVVAQMILAEAVLGYLTVGIEPPQATWGRMLHEVEHYIGSSPQLVAAPAVAIVLAVLGFTRIGDGLSDALKPLPRGLSPRRGFPPDLLVLASAALLVGFAAPPPLAQPQLSPPQRTPQRGGVLRTATAVRIHSLDPALAYNEAARNINDLIFAPLVRHDEMGHLVGVLAEHYSVSEGGLRYRFVLRDGLRFHDGTALGSADIKRSLERTLHPRTPCPAAQLYRKIAGYEAFRSGHAGSLSGIRTPDPRTVEIVLSEADGAFLAIMTMGFAAPVCASAGLNADPKQAVRPCGAGPFKVDTWVPGERVELNRFDSYYDSGKPYLDRVVWQLGMPSRTQRYRFEAGTLDLVRELTGIDVARFDKDPRWARFRRSTTKAAIDGIFLNTELPPFDNRHLRRAVAFAIDSSVLPKLSPSVIEADRIIPTAIPGPPRDEAMRRHDLEAALGEMRLAGYPYDPGSDSGGYPFLIDYLTVPDSFPQTAAELFQQQLARVGLRVRLRLMSWASYLAEVGTRNSAQMGWWAWGADYPDPASFFAPTLTTSAIRDHGSQNVSFFSDPRLDTMIAQAAREPRPGARMMLFLESERLLRDEAPWVPAYSSRRFYLWQPHVHNCRPHALSGLRISELWLGKPPEGRAR